MHTHCKPVSLCAHHEPEFLPEIFKQKGIDAIVLTNHCYPFHCDKLAETHNAQARVYVEAYNRCKQSGQKIGIKVFFGCEIKLINEPNKPEFLLYGISEEDFISSFPLYNKSQKELFDFCNEKDIIMVQAHPYRTEQGYAPADMRYVHGVEIFNPHLSFDSRFEDALKLAQDNNKIKTSGSDFHVEKQAGLAGMIIPDNIDDQFMLRDYLKQNRFEVFNENAIIYKEG